jgi:Surface antigen variable number repeat
MSQKTRTGHQVCLSIALLTLALALPFAALPARASGRALGYRHGKGLSSFNCIRAASPLRSTIERIEITGNRTVRDRVVRRELRFCVGDRFDTIRLAASTRRLMALGFFHSVGFTTVCGSTRRRIVIRLHLIERPPGSFFIYIGAGGTLTAVHWSPSPPPPRRGKRLKKASP